VYSFKLKLYTILLTVSVVDFTLGVSRAVFSPKLLCERTLCLYLKNKKTQWSGSGTGSTQPREYN
jgi:hypothetical protein